MSSRHDESTEVNLRHGQPTGEPAGGRSLGRGSQDSRELTIEEVAALAGMTARNVRAYQQRRMLPAARRNGRRLMYSWEHVTRLRLIRTLHSRGLSLRVIEDLIARGAHEHELARIAQEATPGTSRVRVPVGDLSVEMLRSRNPSAMSELVEAGVVHLKDGELVASSGGLGVAGALIAKGVDIQTVYRVVLIASRAAHNTATRLRTEIADLDGMDNETVALTMRLASVSFSDALLDLLEGMSSLPTSESRVTDVRSADLTRVLPRQP
ncbi:MAG: MerR family transcriptional regulator [Actinomycetales bacterium]